MALWKNPFRRLGGDSALDREIAFHIEELTKANLGKGMSPAESRGSRPGAVTKTSLYLSLCREGPSRWRTIFRCRAERQPVSPL